MRPSSPGHLLLGFTLIELLLVMAVIILLATLTVPALTAVSNGVNLSRGGQMIADQIVQARQVAISKNRNVEMRFIELKDNGGKRYAGLQAWIVDEAGTNKTPLSRMNILPVGVVIETNAAYSALLFGAGATLSDSTNFGSYGTCLFKGFRLRPNGSTDIPIASAGEQAGYLMLKLATAPSSPPDNFYVIQINPITGKVSTLRPQ